jgi:hypothetical protein
MVFHPALYHPYGGDFDTNGTFFLASAAHQAVINYIRNVEIIPHSLKEISCLDIIYSGRSAELASIDTDTAGRTRIDLHIGIGTFAITSFYPRISCENQEQFGWDMHIPC